MATTKQVVVVTDAGPVIHLDELNSLDLLADFSLLLIPQKCGRRFSTTDRNYSSTGFQRRGSSRQVRPCLLALSL